MVIDEKLKNDGIGIGNNGLSKDNRLRQCPKRQHCRLSSLTMKTDALFSQRRGGRRNMDVQRQKENKQQKPYTDNGAEYFAIISIS